MEEDHREPTAYKMIVVGEDEGIVGVHMVGQGSDEAMQGFGVAVKMGGKSISSLLPCLPPLKAHSRRSQHARGTSMIPWRFIQRK